MFPKDTAATSSTKRFKFSGNVKKRAKMEHRIIPCAEGDDEYIAEQLNTFTE